MSGNFKSNIFDIEVAEIVTKKRSSNEIFKILDQKYGKVGTTIRGLRIRDGLTQKQLAHKLNIHQVHISQIERGKRVVGKKLAQKLAKVFRTDHRLFL